MQSKHSTNILNYNLPKELIAKYPPKVRGTSELLVINRKQKEISHGRYYDIPNYIQKNDLIILNNSKVIPARLYGHPYMKTAKIEVVLLHPIENPTDLKQKRWEVIIGNAKRLKNTSKIVFNSQYYAHIQKSTLQGTFIVEFSHSPIKITKEIGQMPIPKYLKRETTEIDQKRYQTVFGKVEGSVAAPTASLNLTPKILNKIKSITDIAYITLYVGWGTFAPIKTKYFEDFKIHQEYVILPQDTVKKIKETKQKGGRIWAFGTTVTRTLEGVYAKFDKLAPYKGIIDIFIYPPYKFNVIDALVTNFHAPYSSVLALAQAFTGRKLLMNAYQIAIQHNYKFLSYGDSCLIL